MPIEIDEVVISVTVTNQAGGGTASAPPPEQDRQALVNEIVERVLQILRDKREP
jgi:Family of unknown function (DUF5908)